MTRRQWQRAFGEAPEDFRVRLSETLDNLEERDMKKRYKFTTTLLAAVVAALLIAGAAFAAERLGVFRILDYANPIRPLEGAEEMVSGNLGSAEDEYLKLTVEAAVYDGQGALVELRLTPRDPERFAVLNDLMQDIDERVYEAETVPVPVPEDLDEAEYLASVGRTAEDAFVEKDGVRYFNPEDQMCYAIRRTDGKTLLNYDVEGLLPEVDGPAAKDMRVEPDNYLDSWDGEEQADGSVRIWGSGFAGRPMGDSLRLDVVCGYRIEDGEYRSLSLPVTLVKTEDTRRVKLVPEGEAELEGFRLRNAEITFSRIRGYLTVEYDFLYRDAKDMGMDFRLYDPAGDEITAGNGHGGWDDMTPGQWETILASQEIQSLDALPEAVELEVFRIGEEGTLGRIRCRVVGE